MVPKGFPNGPVEDYNGDEHNIDRNSTVFILDLLFEYLFKSIIHRKLQEIERGNDFVLLIMINSSLISQF